MADRINIADGIVWRDALGSDWVPASEFERVKRERDELRTILEDEKLLRQAAIEHPVGGASIPLWVVGDDVYSTGLGVFKPLNDAARTMIDERRGPRPPGVDNEASIHGGA